MTAHHVFVPGTLTNPLNGPHGHWTKHRRWAKTWRDRTCSMLFLAWGHRHDIDPREAKRVTFTAHVARLWDDDALPGGCKPIRDALVDMLVIHADNPSSGHQFIYRQVRSKPAHRGVEITVEVA